MKKNFYYTIIALVCIAVVGAIVYGIMNSKSDNAVETEGNTTVEELIKQDQAYFDNMAGKIIFYESRVVMPKAFNMTDNFVAQEVTNIFQQNLDSTTNVYEFKHVINYSEVDVQVHKGTFVLEDRPVYTDSLNMTFDQAFIQAKQSDLIPSQSRYVTLRNPLGPVPCSPCYMIGNDNYGLMVVDAVTGDVTDKNPAFNK